MLDKGQAPTPAAVEAWLGHEAFEHWVALQSFIERAYPGIFQPQWLYGGAKHGWGLRYKKSKPLCTFVPDRGSLKVLIVFGAAERAAAEVMLPELGSHVARDYEQATTYHDGKWLLAEVDDDATLADVERLLLVKRRPPRYRGDGS